MMLSMTDRVKCHTSDGTSELPMPCEAYIGEYVGILIIDRYSLSATIISNTPLHKDCHTSSVLGKLQS